MLMAKKFKLSLILMFAALLIATSIPVSAEDTEDELKLTGDVGLDGRIIDGKFVEVLVFRASASTTNINYDDIQLYISYGYPESISDGRGGLKGRCVLEGNTTYKYLSKSEMDAKGKIELKLNAALNKDRPYCFKTSAYVSRINPPNPARIIDDETTWTIWDPAQHFENWRRYDSKTASINFEPGNDDFIRFRTIGSPIHANVSSFDYYGTLYEVRNDGSLNAVDSFYDKAVSGDLFAEGASSKQHASNKKYKLVVNSITHYQFNNKQLTDYDTYELDWNPPGLQRFPGPISLNPDLK